MARVSRKSFDTNVLFVGPEGGFAERLLGVVESIKGCRFKRLDFSQAESLQQRHIETGLLLVYYGRSSSEQEKAVLFLQRMGNRHPPVPIIVLCENYDPELSSELMRLDTEVVDCMSRPLKVSRLKFLIELLLVRPRCQHAEMAWSSASEEEQKISDRIDGFIFDSPSMRPLFNQLHSIASLETTIFITGETGTGKSHLGRVIHEVSNRKAKPFLTVHCGALPATLMESELFGHVRGAFTGADRDRVGKLAEVRDGTLLLDEVDCVPLDAQVKLLRAIEERTFEPVGANTSQSLRARLIVTSNKPLDVEVAKGRFRADLYYRFNVLSLALPPLRKQPELIKSLAAKFQTDFCSRNSRQFQGMSHTALKALEAFDWPGNIRELRNVIERTSALCPASAIDLKDLPPPIQECYKDPNYHKNCLGFLSRNQLDMVRNEAELKQMVAALERNRHNRTTAAEELGISRVTLYKKLHRYGLI
ncbi:MAG: sigma 54-interacting transcriptional regulator [Thermoguttaceae bacterium]